MTNGITEEAQTNLLVDAKNTTSKLSCHAVVPDSTLGSVLSPETMMGNDDSVKTKITIGYSMHDARVPIENTGSNASSETYTGDGMLGQMTNVITSITPNTEVEVRSSNVAGNLTS